MTSKLERLFSCYSSDLERYAPSYKGSFLCPLCCKVIEKSYPLEAVVAEEHIIPKQLGGRLVTLTCRRCNNDQGSELDANLVRRVRAETRRYPFSARVQVGNGEFGAQLHLPRSQSDLLDIVWIPKQSDPRKLATAKSELASGEEGEIHMQINFGYNHMRSLSGLLRTAYLLMFRYFGYRYVLDVSSKSVNLQIQNPLDSTGVLNGIVWRVEAAMPTFLSMPAITVVRSPVESQCFMVMLRLDADSKHYSAVALPPPGQDGSRFYEHLQSPEASGQRTVAAIEIPKRKFLPLVEIWEEYTRNQE
jgi:hypothetical protein